MTGAEALRDMILAAIVVAGFAVVAVELATARDRAGRAKAASEPAPEMPQRQAERARTALDDAFDLATAQYHAALETGQGGRLPTRKQVAHEMASITGEHDRSPMTTDELLAWAAIADGFNRAFRPPIAIEHTDPDGTAHRW